MINIRFSGKYKSLSDFEWVNIPDFAIITGPNGSGKSQLLNLIGASLTDPHFNPSVTIEGLDLNPQQVFYLRSEWGLDDTQLIDLGNIQQASQVLYNDFVLFQQNHLRQNHGNYKMFTDLVSGLGRPKEDISEDEFYNSNLQIPIVVDQHQSLTTHLSRVFYEYQVRWMQECKLHDMPDKDFRKNYGPPPWEILDEILKEAETPFEFNHPELSLTKSYKLEIGNAITKEKIKFPELSSGEQVIISMVFWLYHAKKNSVLPKLLLLDEPDAHLHPAMTKRFINTICNVLVCNHGLKVIMTTHSPSTVALSPDNSLFVMDNKMGVKIEPTNKDRALRILTAGVPTLSIDHENRRQVFVESEIDVIFYEKVYEKLRYKLTPEISISFISSGIDGNNSYSQVKHVVDKLRNGGNRSVWGIIDWDQRNDGSAFIKVPGKNKRYTLENYIFDPILLAAFLLREKIVTKEELGLTENEYYTDLRGFSNSKLQKIVDYIITKLEPNIEQPADSSGLLVEYVGGQEVNIPSWFLFEGKQLEDKLKITFPQLNEYRRDGEFKRELKKEVIRKVLDEFPDFIPVELFKTLSEIQNSHYL